MAVSVSIATIGTAIRNLSVTGVQIKDIEEIPAGGEDLQTPVMFPRPDGFLSNFEFERMSFGEGGTAKMDLSYTMTYRYLHAKLGSGISQMEAYDEMIDNLALILIEIFENDDISGAVDMQLEGIEVDAMPAPSGEAYHGFDLMLRVQEFAQ